MSEKNLWWKLGGVVVLCLLAGLQIYPPSQRLKAGIDLAGGSSLLYEIDTGGEQGVGQTFRQATLSEEMIQALRRRVDPDNVRNLVWRPVGSNRIEIQMPRPTPEALARRQAYEAAADRLRKTNVTRVEVESAVSKEGDERQQAFEALIREVPERRALLAKVAEAWDALVAARKAKNTEATDQATERYDGAMDELLQTNLPFTRFGDVLAMDNAELRAEELGKLKAGHPSQVKLIEEVVARYDAWAKDKGMLEDPEDLKRLLRGAGVLEFRILPERDPGNPNKYQSYVENLHRRGPRYRAGEYSWHEIAKPLDFLNLDSMEEFDAYKNNPNTRMVLERYAGKIYLLAYNTPDKGLYAKAETPWTLERAMRDRNFQTGRPEVRFEFDPRGGSLFYQLTNDNVGNLLCVLLDDVAYTAPVIRDAISDTGTISGSFTDEEINYLVSTLNAGALPARLKVPPLMERTVGPNLGKVNRDKGLRAAAIGLVVVVIFMAIYYLAAGIIADLALAINLLLVLAVMSTMEATFTLPGIAGLILTVGMAVDANVLIFERIREETQAGANLRMAVKTGYEKAFSTILDANVTTLITCVILGYVGSEEVKGFALTLGLGVATSMFTALVVTRLIFIALIAKARIKSITMLHLIRRPAIDWMGKSRLFGTGSMVLVILGMGTFLYAPATEKYDIEFLGGTSAQITMKEGVSMSDEEVRRRITGTDLPIGRQSARSWLESAAAKLQDATVAEAGAQLYRITVSGLDSSALAAFVEQALGDELVKDGLREADNGVEVAVKADSNLTLDQVTSRIAQASGYVRAAAARLATARVQLTEDLSMASEAGSAFEIVTTETNQRIVREAILAALPDQLKVQQELSFSIVKDSAKALQGYFPITDEDKFLSDVIGGTDAFSVSLFRGGVALVADRIQPPQTVEEISRRLRDMRLQPDFEQYEWRRQEIHGLTPAGGAGAAERFSKVAVLVADEDFPYYDDPVVWERNLAKPELELLTAALSQGGSMEKVTQFAPQVAAQARLQAMVAMVFALAAIVGYIWIRFGSMQFGLAAIMALVHDVSIALGLVTLTDLIAGGPIGAALGFDQTGLRIDLAMIAAFLTIIGYSLNDTIVVFDRIRENRGRLTTLSGEMINTSINQCLSRTLLTSVTTFVVVGIMFAIGGAGIHGFSFSLCVGVIVGTYSSIGVASLLLYRTRTLYTLVPLLAAAMVAGLVLQVPSEPAKWAGLALVVVVTAAAIYKIRGAGPSA